MIRAVIDYPPHVRIVAIPDLGDPPRWARMVAEQFGDLDLYVTANDMVRDLFAPIWPVLHPVLLLPASKRIPLDGTFVRRAMLRGTAWRDLVPPPVAAILDPLVPRYREEFR
jgi:nicotinamide mononucleotide adenylyltransferase